MDLTNLNPNWVRIKNEFFIKSLIVRVVPKFEDHMLYITTIESTYSFRFETPQELQKAFDDICK